MSNQTNSKQNNLIFLRGLDGLWNFLKARDCAKIMEKHLSDLRNEVRIELLRNPSSCKSFGSTEKKIREMDRIHELDFNRIPKMALYNSGCDDSAMLRENGIERISDDDDVIMKMTHETSNNIHSIEEEDVQIFYENNILRHELPASQDVCNNNISDLNNNKSNNNNNNNNSIDHDDSNSLTSKNSNNEMKNIENKNKNNESNPQNSNFQYDDVTTSNIQKGNRPTSERKKKELLKLNKIRSTKVVWANKNIENLNFLFTLDSHVPTEPLNIYFGFAPLVTATANVAVSTTKSNYTETDDVNTDSLSTKKREIISRNSVYDNNNNSNNKINNNNNNINNSNSNINNSNNNITNCNNNNNKGNNNNSNRNNNNNDNNSNVIYNNTMSVNEGNSLNDQKLSQNSSTKKVDNTPNIEVEDNNDNDVLKIICEKRKNEVLLCNGTKNFDDKNDCDESTRRDSKINVKNKNANDDKNKDNNKNNSEYKKKKKIEVESNMKSFECITPTNAVAFSSIKLSCNIGENHKDGAFVSHQIVRNNDSADAEYSNDILQIQAKACAGFETRAARLAATPGHLPPNEVLSHNVHTGNMEWKNKELEKKKEKEKEKEKEREKERDGRERRSNSHPSILKEKDKIDENDVNFIGDFLFDYYTSKTSTNDQSKFRRMKIGINQGPALTLMDRCLEMAASNSKICSTGKELRNVPQGTLRRGLVDDITIMVLTF